MHEKEMIKQATDSLIPGNVIELDTVSDLLVFEDFIAKKLNPNIGTDIRQSNEWDCRVKISDLIRPPKYNGSIINIQLEVMEDPYQQIIQANERGMRFLKGFVMNPPKTEDLTFKTEESYLGFILTADAKSSGQGVIGKIHTELWYAQIPKEKLHPSHQINMKPNSNGGILRYVARPEFEQTPIHNLDKKSRLIGSAVMNNSVRTTGKLHGGGAR